MKFLVTGCQTIPAAGHQTQVNYLEGAKDWVRKLRAEKVLECAFSFPDGGGLFIINAQTNEELMALLLSFPLRALSKFEIQPLVDFEAATDMVIGMIGGITPMGEHVFPK